MVSSGSWSHTLESKPSLIQFVFRSLTVFFMVARSLSTEAPCDTNSSKADVMQSASVWVMEASVNKIWRYWLDNTVFSVSVHNTESHVTRNQPISFVYLHLSYNKPFYCPTKGYHTAPQKGTTNHLTAPEEGTRNYLTILQEGTSIFLLYKEFDTSFYCTTKGHHKPSYCSIRGYHMPSCSPRKGHPTNLLSSYYPIMGHHTPMLS